MNNQADELTKGMTQSVTRRAALNKVTEIPVRFYGFTCCKD